MKLYLPVCLLLLFCASPSYGQTGQVKLLAQSPDGKTVKLAWIINSWNSAITGFDIKRKDGLQDWVKLNTEPILPGIAARKKLSIVDADKGEESALKAKLYKLIATHKLQETDYTQLLQQLNSDGQALKNMNSLAAHDYDIALMSGLAFVDHSITKKTDYQYGLFIAGTNQLLAKVAWNYGEIPDLNAVREITSRSVAKANGIQVIWNADTNKVALANIAGFNIYRQGIRLNNTPIQSVNDKDHSEYTWTDRSAQGAMAYQYSISAESIFGIEGIIKSYTYNPADHPREYKKAEVTEITGLGYYLKDGISIKWTFPKDQEHFLKGFYIEKNNVPDGFKQVSPLLDVATHAYIDKSPSQVNTYVIFRVVAVYADKTNEPGRERIYSYFPVREPPAPQNVLVRTVQGDKKVTAYLSWDTPMQGDTLTEYYRVYSIDTAKDKLIPVTEQPIRLNSFTYIIDHGGPAVYRFRVSAISKNMTESPLSDTITVLTPSLELPQPPPLVVALDGNKATINWQYPAISDLKGFRLLQNNSQIAGESEMGRDAREFMVAALEPGATYTFKIKAIATNGVMSDYSATYTLVIPVSAKK